jgi:transposase
MSERDARKITIIKDLLSGRFTNAQAAKLLGLSIRQVQRLKAEATAHGVMSILHKSRGRKPANALDSQTAATILRTYQTELPAYNFCHATDVFAEEKGIFVSVSTVSRLLKSEGIRSPKAKRRPKKHRSRIARKREGELAQMDASKYDWLSNGSYLHLHGAIDDATGRILALHFEKEETFEGYCELMLQMNRDGHLPREIYTDARSVFCNNKKQKLSLEEELAGKQETRKLDSGLSFSFQGQKYRLPLKTSHRQRVCASPYDTLIIATNRRIGLKVLYKGLALDPEPLEAIPVKKTAKAKPKPLKQKKTPSQNKARESSPWFKHSTLFYSDSRLKSLANPKLHNIQG